MKTSNIKIKKNAQDFFKEKNLKALYKAFKGGSNIDGYLRFRQFPIKFGVWKIISDEKNIFADQYHNGKFSNAGFEFIKILSDIKNIITEKEKTYITDSVNKYIADKQQDLSPLMIELYLYFSFKKSGVEVTIGDYKKAPDLTVEEAGKKFEIECKSVKLGEVDRKSLRGFSSLANTLALNDKDLCEIKMHSAWQIIDPSILADEKNVEKAKKQIGTYIEYNKTKNTKFNFFYGVLNFMADGSSFGNTISNFRKFTELDKNISDFRHGLSYEVVSHSDKDNSPWSFSFYKQVNIKSLAERCARSFREAMGQHKKNGSVNPIVVINLENVYVVEDPFFNGAKFENVMNSSNRTVQFYRHFIEAEIQKEIDWPSCYGLVLVFALPVLETTQGVLWPKHIIWGSPSGGLPADEFPSLVKSNTII